MDRGMQFQQNLEGVELAVIVLSAPTNDIDDLLPLVPQINTAIKQAVPGQKVRVAV